MTFPADSAAGEGFMNTGASLVMSPALLSKYLDAGKHRSEFYRRRESVRLLRSINADRRRHDE